MKVVVHHRLEAVGRAAWEDLRSSARLRAPFLSWAWQTEWLHAFASDRRLDIRTVQDGDGALIGVLPLYEAGPGLHRIVGGADVSDYLDVLAVAGREEDVWTALVQARSAEGETWQLHAVPAASPTVSALPAIAAACGLEAAATLEERCPVLDLPATWDDYLASLPAKHRHELQRKTRRLRREAGDARVSVVRRRDEIETRFGDFFDLHRRSRVGKERFMDARMEKFFRRAVGELALVGGAALWFLDLPSGPAAGFVVLEWDGSVGLYNSGFHPDRAALAPGLVLLLHVIEDAIVRGKQQFDFLRGEERYKYEFGPSPEEVFGVRIAPRDGPP
ncbi:MAG: GNAT family N-acetyltransferase [Candidatus Rokubacteria bacterium]|nr:GNAT family N-acetyltransferase [Candidatus Rokubacteria bacterium]